jgi:hypothetical protein
MDEEDDEIAHPLSYQFPNANTFNVLGISPGTAAGTGWSTDAIKLCFIPVAAALSRTLSTPVAA